ncbi:hypothetical protein L596_026706 [Steinernema carpocapsae]|uniref:7TM GPCR serpentine receptor class x (Srx) domain-containing protein n=1 Tax=Steinernema carpocapsae TaxID=34508 RepID=A0A4U5M250_STECR|nr:hypothetical protein L596_026706 [Steinernema carpocapsae]
MAQQGLVQIFTIPGTILRAITILTRIDFLGLGSFTSKLFAASIRIEACLGFVLSLNRIKIMCGLRYPKGVHTILILVSYAYGIFLVAIMLSPYTDYYFDPDEFVGMYNHSLPWTEAVIEVNRIVAVITHTATLIVYVIIIAYLVWVKHKSSQIANFNNERTILLYAGIRFCFDMVLVIIYFFFTLPKLQWVAFLMALAYDANNLVVSPVLYLTLYK